MRIPRERQFAADADAAAVARYEEARRHLKHASRLERFGFRLLKGFVTADEAAAVLAFVDGVGSWERRGENTSSPMAGTRRLNLGVELNAQYKPTKLTALPPVLAALGRRVLDACRALEWPNACGDVSQTECFDQAYIQRYTPAEQPHEPGQTLGFHYDLRSEYAELIAGVTICGRGRLLLAPTQGSEAVAPHQLTRDNTAQRALPPLSLYALTGMARYDLRHAVVQDGPEERISVTFRSVTNRRLKRA